MKNISRLAPLLLLSLLGFGCGGPLEPGSLAQADTVPGICSYTWKFVGGTYPVPGDPMTISNYGGRRSWLGINPDGTIPMQRFPLYPSPSARFMSNVQAAFHFEVSFHDAPHGCAKASIVVNLFDRTGSRSSPTVYAGTTSSDTISFSFSERWLAAQPMLETHLEISDPCDAATSWVEAKLVADSITSIQVCDL